MAKRRGRIDLEEMGTALGAYGGPAARELLGTEDVLERLREMFGERGTSTIRLALPMICRSANDMVMVGIRAGEFTTGSPPGESGPGGDERQHRRRITKSFYLGLTEVTQAQWRAVMGTNLSSSKDDELPLTGVSWNDAKEFCRKLSEKEGATCRLPKEAEWEYACRAGTTGAYAGPLDEMAWYDSNSGGRTHRVATKQANA